MIGVLFDIFFYPTRLVGIADWLTIVVGIFTALYFWSTAKYAYWDGCGIQVWKPIPLIGSFIPGFMKGAIPAEEEAAASCNNTVRGVFLMRQPVLEVYDADLVQSVTIKNFSQFVNHIGMVDVDNKFFNSFLTTLNDDQWKGMRNVVTPTFSGSKMKMLVPSIDDCACKFVTNIQQYAEAGETMDMKLMAGYFALDTVASALFGVVIDSQAEADNVKKQKAANKSYKDESFSAHADAVFNGTSLMVTIIVLFAPKVIRNMLFSLNIGRTALGEGEHWAFFSQFVEKIIEMRNNNKEQAKTRVDCLKLLLDAHNVQETGDDTAASLLDTTHETAAQVREWKVGKRELTHDEIVANAMLFYLAGFETTSTTLSWTLYSLAAQPEAQNTLFEEITQTCPKGTTLTYDLVSGMPYLDAVINETLRLYPPVIKTDRVCTGACKVGDVQMRTGDWLTLSIWAIHHNEQYWEHPYTFRPDRFLPNEKSSIKPCTFLPFGVGPRNCIGQRLAYLEMKIALIRVLQCFSFKVDLAKTSVPPEFAKQAQFTAAKDGIHLFVQRR